MTIKRECTCGETTIHTIKVDGTQCTSCKDFFPFELETRESFIEDNKRKVKINITEERLVEILIINTTEIERLNTEELKQLINECKVLECNSEEAFPEMFHSVWYYAESVLVELSK